MLKILQVGIGPLGLKMIKMSVERGSEQVVAATDIRTDLKGRDLGDLIGTAAIGVEIMSALEDAIGRANPDVAILTTVSDMQRITPQILKILEHRIPVVSTCEELSYAWEEDPANAHKINEAAIRAGVAVLGTGVNPGFLMDSLPAMLTAVCQDVQKVEVKRYQDASFRRIPFQQKIGAGLTMEEYEAKRATGTLRHVGLTESMQFIARQLGWKLDRTNDVLSPVVAKSKITTGVMVISQGQASGVRQVGSGYIGKTEKIRLEFQAAVGEEHSYDEIRITGTPNVVSRIEGGVNGDIATCAITLNAAHSVVHAQPGLRTMGDVPMVTYKS